MLTTIAMNDYTLGDLLSSAYRLHLLGGSTESSRRRERDRGATDRSLIEALGRIGRPVTWIDRVPGLTEAATHVIARLCDSGAVRFVEATDEEAWGLPQADDYLVDGTPFE